MGVGEPSHPLTDFFLALLWSPGLAFCLVFSALFYDYNLFLVMKGQKILLVEPCSPDLHSGDSE